MTEKKFNDRNVHSKSYDEFHWTMRVERRLVHFDRLKLRHPNTCPGS